MSLLIPKAAETYDQRREAFGRWVSQELDQVTEAELREVSEELGIKVDRTQLIVQTSRTNILRDHVLFRPRGDQPSRVEQAAAKNEPGVLGEVLHAAAKSRWGTMLLKRIVPGVGVEAMEIPTHRNLAITDRRMSHQPLPKRANIWMNARLLCFSDGTCMTSAAGYAPLKAGLDALLKGFDGSELLGKVVGHEMAPMMYVGHEKMIREARAEWNLLYVRLGLKDALNRPMAHTDAELLMKRDAGVVVKEYDELRRYSRTVNDLIMKTIRTDVMREVIDDLGIKQGNVVMLGSTSAEDIIADHLCHRRLESGLTPYEAHGKDLDIGDPQMLKRILDMHKAAHYTWMQVQSVVPSVGLLCYDLMTGKTFLLADHAGSMNDKAAGQTLLGRIMPWSDFYVTNGSFVPIGGGSAQQMVDVLQDSFVTQGLPDSYTDWSDDDKAAFELRSLQLIFGGGFDRFLMFADEHLNQPKRQTPVVTGRRKVGRNDPCPCNSGRKYKKCCGGISQ